MPLIEITLTEGRSAEALAETGRAVTLAAAQALSADPASIRLLIRELPEHHWFVGGTPLPEERLARAAAKERGGR